MSNRFAIYFDTDQTATDAELIAIKRHLMGIHDYGVTISRVEDLSMKRSVGMDFVTPTVEAVTARLLPVANQFGTNFMVVSEDDLLLPFHVNQTELNSAQIERQDEIDNAVQAMLTEAADIMDVSLDEDEWNIEHISRLRAIMIELICNALKLTTERAFYPYIKE